MSIDVCPIMSMDASVRFRDPFICAFLARLYVIYRKSANYLKNCAALIAALLTIDVCNIDLVLFCSSQLKTETLGP